MESLDQSHVNRHDVRLVERLRTVWALPHTVGNSILNTVVAESMATSSSIRIQIDVTAYLAIQLIS